MSNKNENEYLVCEYCGSKMVPIDGNYFDLECPYPECPNKEVKDGK
jgi:hypothetical protein